MNKQVGRDKMIKIETANKNKDKEQKSFFIL